MINNKMIKVFCFVFVFIILIGFCSAVTGSTRSGRMVLRGDIGDILEKFVIVQNVNDVPIRLELFASGDLEDFINIKDYNFTLSPGEEKKAYFNIKVGKGGTTESKINMQFTALGEKNGVGLSSAIIVIADGTNNDDLYDEQRRDNNTDLIDDDVIADDDDSNLGVVFLLAILVALLLVALALILMPKKIKQKKRLSKGE